MKTDTIQAESEDETMGLRVYATLQGALPTPPTLPSASLFPYPQTEHPKTSPGCTWGSAVTHANTGT